MIDNSIHKTTNNQKLIYKWYNVKNKKWYYYIWYKVDNKFSLYEDEFLLKTYKNQMSKKIFLRRCKLWGQKTKKQIGIWITFLLISTLFWFCIFYLVIQKI